MWDCDLLGFFTVYNVQNINLKLISCCGEIPKPEGLRREFLVHVWCSDLGDCFVNMWQCMVLISVKTLINLREESSKIYFFLYHLRETREFLLFQVFIASGVLFELWNVEEGLEPAILFSLCCTGSFFLQNWSSRTFSMLKCASEVFKVQNWQKIVLQNFFNSLITRLLVKYPPWYHSTTILWFSVWIKTNQEPVKLENYTSDSPCPIQAHNRWIEEKRWEIIDRLFSYISSLTRNTSVGAP